MGRSGGQGHEMVAWLTPSGTGNRVLGFLVGEGPPSSTRNSDAGWELNFYQAQAAAQGPRFTF